MDVNNNQQSTVREKADAALKAGQGQNPDGELTLVMSRPAGL